MVEASTCGNVFALMKACNILVYFISAVKSTTKKLTGPRLTKVDPSPSVIQIFVLYNLVYRYMLKLFFPLLWQPKSATAMNFSLYLQATTSKTSMREQSVYFGV